MKAYIKYFIIGRLRNFFGFCPKCNSDAPKLYDCTVCEYSKAPKEYRMGRYKHELGAFGIVDWFNGEDVKSDMGGNIAASFVRIIGLIVFLGWLIMFVISKLL